MISFKNYLKKKLQKNNSKLKIQDPKKRIKMITSLKLPEKVVMLFMEKFFNKKVPNKELNKVIKRISKADKKFIFQYIDLLNEAIDNGMDLKDIKGDNLMKDNKGLLKVIDPGSKSIIPGKGKIEVVNAKRL